METGGKIIAWTLASVGTLASRALPGRSGRQLCRGAVGPPVQWRNLHRPAHRMIETSGVIEKEQGNGFYLVTLEQPAGHQCLCRAAGKLTKFRIKLLAGDKVLVEISPYDLSRGRITYRERNAGAAGPRPGGNRPGGPRRR